MAGFSGTDAVPAEPGGTGRLASGTEMFGREVKAQRLRKNWTQVELAAQIGYSDSYLSDIERGKLASLPVAEKLDEAFGLPGTFARMHAAASLVAFPSWFAPVVAHEQQAVRISGWELGVPGLLQTEDYARSLIRATRHSDTDEQVERLVTARMERQLILAGDRAPRLWYVLDESALRRVVGSREIMAAQMGRLIAVATKPGNIVQVLSFADGGLTAGPITVYEFASQPSVAYAEANRGGRLIEEHAEVQDMVHDVAMIRTAAMSPRDSVECISDVRSDYEQ